ncbi:MAG: DUF364 domain-containing protein [Haloarculaceae archaeon]
MTSELLTRVAGTLSDRAEAAEGSQVTVGEGVVLVEVIHPAHGRLAGLAHRPEGALTDVGVGVETASVPALVALATGGETNLGRAVGVAALNALSAPDVDWRVGDPMAALSSDVETVATVGFFGPALRKFDAVAVRVVERDPPERVDAPDSVAVELFAPENCETAFAGADLCFITGSALVYGGVDRYLSVLSDLDVAPVVLVGATASLLPGPAFDAGVDVVAGARVTDPGGIREQVAGNDCATDLHEAGVEKVYVARDDRLPGLRLGEGGG